MNEYSSFRAEWASRPVNSSTQGVKKLKSGTPTLCEVAAIHKKDNQGHVLVEGGRGLDVCLPKHRLCVVFTVHT